MRRLRKSSRFASWVGMNAVPHQTPTQPIASAAARPRPSPIPPAATTGTGDTASSTCGSSAIVPMRPVCPPASWPCATTMSAPPSATRRAFFTLPTSEITVPLASCT